MRYCQECATPLTEQIPLGDHLPRAVCPHCGHIHYENPKLIVGCLATFEERILLCRRAIEPRLGLWTLPAGFMENGESAEAGAIRETLEEACARVCIDDLFAMYSLPAFGQVYLLFRAHLQTPHFAATPESLEVALFHENEIPWEQLAFDTVRQTLQHYLADKDQGTFRLHRGVIGETCAQDTK